MYKNSVGSIWGTLAVPVPWLVAGGWGDGWCRCHGWWLVAVAGSMPGGGAVFLAKNDSFFCFSDPKS